MPATFSYSPNVDAVEAKLLFFRKSMGVIDHIAISGRKVWMDSFCNTNVKEIG